MLVEILPTTAILHVKSPLKFEKTCNRSIILKVAEGHRKRRYSISHISAHIHGLSVVTAFLSCSVSEILPHFQRTWLPVTLRSPSVSIRQLKLILTCLIVLYSWHVSGASRPLSFVMVALCNRADHYILPCVFVLLLSSIFFPRLISAAADWMSTILVHMAWP